MNVNDQEGLLHAFVLICSVQLSQKLAVNAARLSDADQATCWPGCTLLSLSSCQTVVKLRGMPLYLYSRRLCAGWTDSDQLCCPACSTNVARC